MFSRFCCLAFKKHVARPKVLIARQLFTQSASKNYLAITSLAAFTGIIVSSFFGSCYVYYTKDDLRRNIRSGLFFAKLYHTYCNVKKEKNIRKLNKRWAPKTLQFILNMGGYYTKLAQTSVGAGELPEEYTRVFETLLDRLPPQRFEVIQAVVEAELGCKIDDIFDSFDRHPLGVGCIGQVHRASLKGSGREVVVKVQHPGVESTFKSDFKMMSATLHMAMKISDDFPVLMENLFQVLQTEFDYTIESDNLRQVSSHIMPVFGRQVFVPLPIDDDHPDAPNRSLCTRRVLTMEYVEGTPIHECINEIIQKWAETEGKTLSQCDEDMIAIYDDPQKLRSILSNENETATPAILADIVQRLCDVHAHQIFMNGVFNSDPHAGNVLMMSDGRLGLIDYGACDTLSYEERDAFARLCVGIADADEAASIDALNEFGDSSRKLATVERCLMLLMGISLHVGLAPMVRMFAPTARKYLDLRSKTVE